MLQFICFVFGALLLFPATASAYIDPTTTAMVTQIIAGVFISLGLALGVFRQKIILFFKNMKIKHIQRKIEKDNKKQNMGR